MAQMPYGYYNRFNESKKYEKHLFTAGSGLQSAELNEIQEYSLSRIRNLGNALFKDGDIISDARVVLNQTSGLAQAQAGQVYVGGAVRSIPARNFTISVSGEVTIGIFLIETVVTSLEDGSLRDPAAGTRNYQEPGASRLKIDAKWGHSEENISSEFFPVYEAENGVLKAKEAPPNMDSVTQAIARYDRDSAGSGYIVSGLSVTKLNDSADGKQNYSMAAGRARVRGLAMEFRTAVRLNIDPTPELNFVDSEPQVSTTTGRQRVDLDYYPVANVTQVRITAQKTVTMTHGAYSGAIDQIEDESVLQIMSVTQGGTTYVQGTDYKLTNGKVDWSLNGAEPSPGSTYTLVYQAITSVNPDSVDATGCYVSGAVVNSLILVSYNQKLPRIDRVAITDEGEVEYIKGVSSAYNPTSPMVPENMLPIATIVQTWDSKRRVVNDGIRVVPMNEIVELRERIDHAFSLIAQQRLESNINIRESGAKKGLFTDPFIDDSQRDAGIPQSAAIFDGEMSLAVYGGIAFIDTRSGKNVTHVPRVSEPVILQQTARTGVMKVNPYMAFSPLPANVTLTPSVDRWVDVKTSWSSPVTKTLVVGFFSLGLIERVDSVSVNNNLLSSRVTVLSELRQIDVRFEIEGFGPGETLSSVTFDGIPVTATAI